MRDAGGVDGVAGREVVAAIDDHVGLCDERVEPGRVRALAQRDHVHVGIDGADRAPRRIGLGLADARQVVRDLALQVGEIDRIVVDDGDRPDTGRAEVQRDRGPQPAGADHERVRSEQLALAFDPDLVEQDMARVAQQLVVVHRWDRK